MNRKWLAIGALMAAVAAPSEATAQIAVIGNSVQEHSVEAGERYTGEIRILNEGSEARAVRVYQTDYLFQADGTNSYGAPGSHARSNAQWVTVTPTDVMIPAGEAVEITYSVAVPAEPGIPGTYWSMVMVEPTDAPAEALTDPSDPSIGLRTTIRFGIQIATHVAGEVDHRLQIVNPQLVVDEAGARHLEFVLLNDGAMGYRPKVSLEVFDQSGGQLLTKESQRGLIYPGTSAVQRFDLSLLPSGVYQAVVVADTGSQEVFGAQFNLTIGSGN